MLGITVALDGLALNFELRDLARNFVEPLRHRVHLDAQLGGSLIHEVDGLVGQEAVADVALAQLHGGNDGLVFDAHLVVVFIFLFQATHDGDGTLLVGFVDHHNLEAAFQSLVLLEVLLVLVEGSGTYAAQFTAREGGFQDVGGIHSTAALAGTHQGVNLVDEEDNLAIRLGDFVDYGFESFLKFALVLGTSDECAHVEREHLLLAQVLGHIATHNALGQSFHNSGLAGTRLANEDGVVLGAATQDLQHAADFVVTANHRVEFALAGTLVEVDGILRKGVVLFLGLLTSGFLALAQFGNSGIQVLLSHAGTLQDG